MAVQFSLDHSSEGGFLKYLKSLPEKPSTTVRLFDRSEYYTVHGEDALLAAKEVFHTNSVIKYFGSGDTKVPSVALSRLNFEEFVRTLLLVRQYRVEILRPKSKAGNDWTVAYKASPGNLQQLEDVLFSGTDMAVSSCVMAVRVTSEGGGGRRLGVAHVDLSTRTLSVGEFTENDQFSTLEALLVQLSPRECLVLAGDSHCEATKLRQMLQRSNVLVTERKKGEFSSKDILQDLNRLLKLPEGTSATTLSQIDQQLSMSSLAALIKYLELLSDEANFSSFLLSSIELGRYLHLDAAAARALNLEPIPGEASNMSLTGLLNKCRTAPGQRLLVQWVRQPLTDRNKIEERLNIVEVLVSDAALRQSLFEEQLRRMPDLCRMARKLVRGKGSLQDCVRLYQALQQLPSLIETLEGHVGPHRPLIDELFVTPLKELNDDFTKFIEMVEATIDLSQVEHHEFVIKPSFDEGLQELRTNMDTIETKINSQFRKTASDLGLELHKTIKLESNAQLGYFLRVTKKVEKCLRGQKRFSILETRNDGVRFTQASLRSLSEEYCVLREQYSETQASLVEEVLQITAGYVEPLHSLSDLLAQLDVLVSFAHVSATAPIPFVRPTLTPLGEGDIELVAARHPCLEVQDDVAFIANDVRLVRDKDMFQIITGPNMGGKSTYIRQIGVIVLLAQVGCFVPCRSATISIVDSILARVGAGDSQLKGVSTFMAEMLETASILQVATKNSLIIIDELGRGTSTYDGFGLAWAISEHIATKIKCFCVFATHFHELTDLASMVSTVSNLHVSALTTDGAITLLYRIQPGVCDQSFGIHVAELAHFPAEVVEFARCKAAELEVFRCPVMEKKEEEEEEAGEGSSVKRWCGEVEEGERLIHGFLRSVQELPQSGMSTAQLSARLGELKAEILAKGNSYVASIIDQQTV